MHYTLNSSNRSYNLSLYDGFTSLVSGLSGIPYSKRHWELSNKGDPKYFLGHRIIAVAEALPLIGGLIALIERISVFAYLSFKSRQIKKKALAKTNFTPALPAPVLDPSKKNVQPISSSPVATLSDTHLKKKISSTFLDKKKIRKPNFTPEQLIAFKQRHKNADGYNCWSKEDSHYEESVEVLCKADLIAQELNSSDVAVLYTAQKLNIVLLNILTKCIEEEKIGSIGNNRKVMRIPSSIPAMKDIAEDTGKIDGNDAYKQLFCASMNSCHSAPAESANAALSGLISIISISSIEENLNRIALKEIRNEQKQQLFVAKVLSIYRRYSPLFPERFLHLFVLDKDKCEKHVRICRELGNELKWNWLEDKIKKQGLGNFILWMNKIKDLENPKHVDQELIKQRDETFYIINKISENYIRSEDLFHVNTLQARVLAPTSDLPDIRVLRIIPQHYQENFKCFKQELKEQVQELIKC